MSKEEKRCLECDAIIPPHKDGEYCKRCDKKHSKE